MRIFDASDIRKSLKKTVYNDGRVFSLDSSSLLSFSKGAVSMHISLPGDISNGIYSRCDNDKYFSDYLLFAVNPVGQFISPPGMYAALTPNGVEFTIWTASGMSRIIDTSMNVDANTPFIVTFCWNSDGKILGSGAKMAIFEGSSLSSSNNFRIDSSDSLSGVELTMLDNHTIDYGTECEVFDIVIFSGVPYSMHDSVNYLSEIDFGSDFVAMMYADGLRVLSSFSSPNTLSFDEVGTLSSGKQSLAVSDSDRVLYVMSTVNDGLGYSSSVVSIDTHDGTILNRFIGLDDPVAVGITQYGGIDYPRTSYPYPCRYVWICESDEIIKASSELVEMSRKSGYTGISCIAPTSDGRVWVVDRAAGSVSLLSEDMLSDEIQISVSDPVFAGVTIFNDIFVYDNDTQRIIKYTDGNKVNSNAPGQVVTSMDVRAHDGYIVASLEDGSVKVYNSVVEERYSWSYKFASKVFFRRGYRRNTVYVVDDIFGRVYEMTIWGSVLGSYSMDPGIFMGSSVSLANNFAPVYSEITVDASYESDDGTISDASVAHYKVDQVPVELTGGGPNDASYYGARIGKGDAPLDLRSGVSKGARIK
jgi:hypothetical protein